MPNDVQKAKNSALYSDLCLNIFEENFRVGGNEKL
jgi:hypothetical protein